MNADALKIESNAVEVQHLTVVGNVPGVVPLLAAARNGPGVGRLACAAGGLLSWRAPGSSAAGPEVDVSAGGTFVLTDGDDADRWIRVEVHTAHLAETAQAEVFLADRYNNAVAGPDVSAEEAAAGDVRNWSLSLRNTAKSDFHDLRVWLHAGCDPWIEIGLDGEHWSQPRNEEAALTVSLLPAGESATMWIRRAVPAGQPAHAKKLVKFNMIFDGLPI